LSLPGAVRANKSGLRGVVRVEGKRKTTFIAQISVNGRTKFLGRRDTADAAARLYDEHARALWGAQAVLNFSCDPQS